MLMSYMYCALQCHIVAVEVLNTTYVTDFAKFTSSHFIYINTVSPRGHLFYVDFLFLIFTSHRGGNVSTAVRTFPPR